MIPIEDVAGLRPSVWLCVGAGYAREELKSILLSSGRGFVADAVTTVDELTLKIATSSHQQSPFRVLGALARQEVLRTLLSESRINSRMPELKRLRRQSSFFRRLDDAIQAGRIASSHDQEAEVYEERLRSRFGENPVRDEVRMLAQAYEIWLEALGFVDPPRLMKLAVEKLQNDGWPSECPIPKRILYFSVEKPESLEQSFWDQISQFTEVVRYSDLSQVSSVDHQSFEWRWERWHTHDDACERLAEALSREPDWNEHVVLIPDSPSIRRSLKRALRTWGVPEADPRDPLRVKWDEALKWALLPLQVIGKNFERSWVIAWIKSHSKQNHSTISAWIDQINGRGIRQSLRSYSGGDLDSLHTVLQSLSEKFSGKKTCAEMAEAHLQLLDPFSTHPEMSWVVTFFEQQWKLMMEDWELLGAASTRAPLLYWLDKFQNRIHQAPAPVEQQRPSQGLRVYRLQQAPIEVPIETRTKPKTIWILGLSSGWLSGQGVGDYWYGEREREVLSSEFAVRSGIQLREERLQCLKFWLKGIDRVHLLDAAYSPDGRELETLLPLLKELSVCGGTIPEEPLEKGSHPRWVRSYGAIRPLQPQKVRLSPRDLKGQDIKPEISASTLERYSKCSFQGLAFDRWRVRDTREPDCELWPDVRGTLLHEAVKILLKSWTDDAGFSCTLGEALEAAWKIKPPQGLIRSPRLEKYLKDRMLQVLEGFCEKEREYRKRSQARILSLDEGRLKLEFPEFSIVGTPDRIDQTDDGVFLMDYKTSSALPNGIEMIELGYRLQLPFYALAAGREVGQPVLGVQFIELGRRANRGNGIFFKRYNGKEQGKLTAVTARSKSLISLEPEETWQRLEAHIQSHGAAYLRGEFSAQPKKPDHECSSCPAGDLCGYRRRVSDGLEGGENGN